MGLTISFICPWELSFQSRTIMKLLLMTGIFLHPIFLFLYLLSNLPNSSFYRNAPSFLLPTHIPPLKCMPCRSFKWEISPALQLTFSHVHRGRRLEIISPRLFARVASSLIIQGETLLEIFGRWKEQLPLQQQ